METWLYPLPSLWVSVLHIWLGYRVAQFCSPVMKVFMWQRKEKTWELDESHLSLWVWTYVHIHDCVTVLKCITSTLRNGRILGPFSELRAVIPFCLLLCPLIYLVLRSVPISGGSMSATGQRRTVGVICPRQQGQLHVASHLQSWQHVSLLN